MRTPRTPRARDNSRRLLIAVAAVWAVALALGGYLIWYYQAGASAQANDSASESSTPNDVSLEVPTTTTEAPTTTTTTLPNTLTVAAGGDVHGDRRVGTFIDKNGAEPLFAEVKPYMEGADLAFVNLEAPISDTGSRNPVKEYTFRSRPALIDGLVSADINMVSLANNHSLDYRWAALEDCIARLDAAGIAHAGAGANSTEASAATILDVPAGKVAFIAASEITSSFAAGTSRPGTYYTWSPNESLVAKVTAAAQSADFVIVSIHWGTEYEATANSHQINLAHSLVDAGADLILGHHPHVIQGLEIYKDRLIAYSLGDFVWDWHSPYAGEAFVLQVSIPKDGTAPSVTIVPVYLSQSTGTPSVVTGDTADRILSRLTSLSAKRGLELQREGDVATIGGGIAVDQW